MDDKPAPEIAPIAVTLELPPDLIQRLELSASVRDVPLCRHIREVLEEAHPPFATPDERATEAKGPARRINEAIQAMKELQIANRETAVDVITQRNNIYSNLAHGERIVRELLRRAEEADKSGDEDLADGYRREAALHQEQCARFLESCASADEVVDAVRQAIKDEEHLIRRRVSEALVFKMRIEQARVVDDIERAFGTKAAQGEQGNRQSDLAEWLNSMDPRIKARIEQNRRKRAKLWPLRLRRTEAP